MIKTFKTVTELFADLYPDLTQEQYKVNDPINGIIEFFDDCNEAIDRAIAIDEYYGQRIAYIE